MASVEKARKPIWVSGVSAPGSDLQKM